MIKKVFEITNEQTPYSGFFNIKKYTLRHSLFQGGWSKEVTREVFHRGDCVAVLLYDPNRDEVVIIEQFRAGAILSDKHEDAWLLEIVAGAIESGETPVQVAKREALEEAGCEVEELIKINEFFTSPGGTSERITLFCGRVDSTHIGGIHGLEDEQEDIAVSCMPFLTAYELLQQGRIISSIPIIALQWLFINRESLQKQWL
ncbi:MAG TPA: NUDIX domain-containing protein [Methylophaga aminisulfidivorans]|uniref:ADP-ribose pyrophosphatase n=2 Tax=root TaxID=1 RepID=A0A7C1W8C9_9GAMM|nr:NUDIX domain-containing protein [Methylophaga sp.]HEC74818.1 NUDIX domain-containing protein [Methylophaga aminisulfidivorans]